MSESNSLSKVEHTVGQILMKALYEQITGLRMPWQITPQQQQQAVLDQLRAAVDQAVTIAVRRVAVGDFEHVVADIESIAIKDTCKVVCKAVPVDDEQLLQLIRRARGKAVLVFADPEAYIGALGEFRAQADQPELPLGDAA